MTDLKENVVKQFLSGEKDSTSSSEKPLENTKKNAEKTIKNTLNSLIKKKDTSKN